MRKKKLLHMTEAEADFDGIVYQLNRMPRVRRALELLADPSSTRRTRMELNVMAARYRFAMALTPGGIVYIPAPGTNRAECGAIRLLLSLDPKRIKRCDWCNEWFYAASRLDQRFCKSGNCRQEFHQRDPVKYADKLAKMRDNYRESKARERRQRKAFLS